MDDLITCDLIQIKGEVHERNVYRLLLEKCLVFFNNSPNMKNPVSGLTSYQLAAKIEKAFKGV